MAVLLLRCRDSKWVFDVEAETAVKSFFANAGDEVAQPILLRADVDFETIT
jgi:hypothetical protein